MPKIVASLFCLFFLLVSCGSSNFKQAVIHQENAEYDKALKFYEKAISKEENVAQAAKNMGDIFFIQREFNKAFEYYKKSIETNPNLPMDHVFNLLSDSNKDVRVATKNMLVQIQNKVAKEKIFEHLSSMLKSGQQYEKLDALEVIASFGNSAKPVIKDVINLIDDENVTVKQKVFEVLPKVADIAIPAGSEEKLYELLNNHSSDMIKTGVIECVGKMKQINNFVPLMEIAKAKSIFKGPVSKTIRIANPASKEAVENIKKYFNDNEPQMRLLALYILKRMGNGANSSVPEIILLCSDSDTNVSKEAERVLSAIKVADKSTVPNLIKLLNHKDKNIKLKAIRWLANVGADAADSIEELKKLTKDDDKEISASAMLALRQIR